MDLGAFLDLGAAVRYGAFTQCTADLIPATGGDVQAPTTPCHRAVSCVSLPGLGDDGDRRRTCGRRGSCCLPVIGHTPLAVCVCVEEDCIFPTKHGASGRFSVNLNGRTNGHMDGAVA